MAVITEYDQVLGEYEEVALPGLPRARRDGVALLRRRSGRATRRAVLYLPGLDGPRGDDSGGDGGGHGLPGALADWYDERGYGCYLAGLGPPDGGTGAAASLDRALAALDAMAASLRDSEGVETLIVSGHAAGATVAALWCAGTPRQELYRPGQNRPGLPSHGQQSHGQHSQGTGRQGPADALVLTAPSMPGRGRKRSGPWPAGTGRLQTAATRRLAAGLDIGCPVLVLTGTQERPARRGATHPELVPTGPHVTSLRLSLPASGPLPPPGPEASPFYHELGRWLGVYLSGSLRDQLL
jgi:hypothetical protein